MVNREAKKLNQSCHAGQRTHLYTEPSMNLEMSDSGVSGSNVVSMMQTAEPRRGNDLCIRCCALTSLSLSRRLLAQPEMRPILVVIADVFVHQAFQMAFVENDDMVEEVSAAIPNKPLSHAVLPGALKAGLLGLDAEALNRLHLNPSRCQRTIVSGSTMRREPLHPDHNRRRTNQNNLSLVASRG